jgi:hypothetical protein
MATIRMRLLVLAATAGVLAATSGLAQADEISAANLALKKTSLKADFGPTQLDASVWQPVLTPTQIQCPSGGEGCTLYVQFTGVFEYLNEVFWRVMVDGEETGMGLGPANQPGATHTTSLVIGPVAPGIHTVDAQVFTYTAGGTLYTRTLRVDVFK